MKYITLLRELYRLKRNTKRTKAQIQKVQREKFQTLVKYAYQHSEYYKKVFNEAGINETNISSKKITDFPTIDKKILLEHFDELVTDKNITQHKLRIFDENETIEKRIYKEKYHLVHSSGSTGKPAYFLYDKTAWNTMLFGIIRAALWKMSMFQIIKLLIEKPRIVYIAATDGRYGGVMAVGDGINSMKFEQMHLDIQRPVNEWLDTIIRFKPNMIIGYPSAIKILAELVKEGRVQLDVTRVITCGEPLHPNLRTIFEHVFECDVVNVYGASESLAMGVGMTGEEGVYLFDDLNLIEVYEDEIYLTCLYNISQPLIRYRLNDQLHVMEEEKSKIPFTKVKTILGREEDLLWFEDDLGNREFVHPLSVEGICVEGLIDYQFRKVDDATFEMLAEVDETANQRIVKKEILHIMRRILDEKELFYVQFYVRFVTAIQADSKTGKKKLIFTDQ
ncbi:MAG: AMP-binding protein [bacterium]|nr:AMP-binding protein [bacterium]